MWQHSIFPIALVPDVVIEIASPSGRWTALLEKLAEYRSRGAYAVAIDPGGRNVSECGSPPAALCLDFEAIIDA